MPLASSLPNLLMFCTSFEQGSFSKAARLLGVTPQAASRSLVRLEETLGVTLFRRTTRAIAPTDAARTYYRTAKAALELLQQAESELTVPGAATMGLVRLSAPTTYGHQRLLPALAGFRERYPGVELEVHIGNRNIHFANEGYDLAIRVGQIREPGLVARKLGDFALGIYGAPNYLARRGTPRNPAQLAEHSCIGFLMPSTGRLLPWSFSPSPRSWLPRARLRCTEDITATITLARAGAGLVQTYDFLVERELQSGELVEVLREFRGTSRPFSLIYPKTPKRSPTAATLIDYLLATSAHQRSSSIARG